MHGNGEMASAGKSGFTILGDRALWDQGVNIGMVIEIPAPGLQDACHA
jgi:hypothetical protein